ncbi:hypothetical protein RMATCC62417_08453 [Rhizopus microsporus]|nr:hypothetical protein RMATCC62417_08453 [Rhizopus microsporus]
MVNGITLEIILIISKGSGSGQQSVTAFPEANDANSLWLVEAGSGLKCKRGEPVPCGSIIRLKHVNTRSYLHSHAHQSPLSRQQEVSCYDGQDSGDDWKVECDGQYWTRENVVQLAHQDTSAYLSSSDRYQFGQPIPGQLEVAAVKGSSKNTQWIAQVSLLFLSLYSFFFNTHIYNIGRYLFCFHLSNGLCYSQWCRNVFFDFMCI